jgi:photosystem II stability/assembly factor-like uncharacterized protein
VIRCLAAVGIWLAVAAPASAATWRDLAVPGTSRVSTIIPSRTVPGQAWSPIDGQKLLITQDGGLSWAPSPDVAVPPVQDALPSRCWRVGGPGIERSDDGGVTWQGVPGLAEALKPTVVSLYGTSVGQLLADPVRSGVLYVIARVYQASDDYGETVFESPDGGITWLHWPYAKDHTSRGDRGFVTTWSVLPGRDALLLVRAGALVYEVEQEVSIVSAAGSARLHYGTGTRGPGDEGSGTIVGLSYTGRAALDAAGTRVLLESKRGWQLSTDTGAHFHLLQPAIAAHRVPPVFDPSQPRRIYALRNARLFRSDDEGRSWHGLTAGLRNVQGMTVDAGGLMYVYGPAGLATSQDAGATFASLSSLATPIAITALRDDAHGGLLAATDAGVWRIGPDERWTPIDRGLFPLPATSAAPLGQTRDVLVVRPALDGAAERSADPGPSLEVLLERGGARVLALPPRPAWWWGIPWRAIVSDSKARQIALGADWTATGGRIWHIARATGTAAGRSASGVAYSTRDDLRKAHRSSLWSRSGKRPWKRVAQFAGTGCRPFAGETQRVYVACSDRLLRSDDAGRTLRRVALPRGALNGVTVAVDQRRPDHIALQLLAKTGCTLALRTITFTSTDGGATWLQTDDACGGEYNFELAIAPNGDLLRWSRIGIKPGLQILDGWR